MLPLQSGGQEEGMSSRTSELCFAVPPSGELLRQLPSGMVIVITILEETVLNRNDCNKINESGCRYIHIFYQLYVYFRMSHLVVSFTREVKERRNFYLFIYTFLRVSKVNDVQT